MRYLLILLITLLTKISVCQDIKTETIGDYPFTSDVVLTDSILSRYDIKKLNIIRNEIFARKGYVFSTEPYISYFTNKGWYKPVSKNVSLNEIERKNVEIIKLFEKKIKPQIVIDDCIQKTSWGSMELPLRLWNLNLNGKQINSLEEVLNLLTEEQLSMIGTLNVNDNLLKNLNGIERFKNLEGLYASGNYIMKIENLYKLPNLKEINLSNNYIKKVENLPDTLNTLFLSRNQISVLENIPVIVNFLSVDENPLRRVIIDLENSSTKATTIEKFWIND